VNTESDAQKDLELEPEDAENVAGGMILEPDLKQAKRDIGPPSHPAPLVGDHAQVERDAV
jgi:hypothetical protein